MLSTGKMLRIFILLHSVLSTLALNLCCPPDKHLHETKQYCADGPPAKQPFKTKAQGFKKTFECVAYEVYSVDDVELLEQNDEIRVRRYKDPIPPNDYCVDGDKFILCDKCQQSGIECINLCCPFNHMFEELDLPDEFYSDVNNVNNGSVESADVEYFNSVGLESPEEGSTNITNDYDLGPNPCVQSTSPMPPLKFYRYKNDGEKANALDWKEGSEYIYVGPKKMADTGHYQYSCPGEYTYFYSLNSTDELFLDYKARLHNVIREDGNADGAKEILDKGSYCVTYDKEEKVQYKVCSLPEEVNSPCEDTRKVVFNVGFVLSIIGIILSIATHFLNKVTLRQQRFGQICVMYLINMLGQFTMIVVERFNDFQSETTSCEAVGYLQQYFYLAFFFSLSALGYNSFRMVRTMDGDVLRFGFLDPEKSDFLYFCIGYIQGVPFLITMITYGIDNMRKQNGLKSHESLSYPEMAVYPGSCFLGYQQSDTSNRPSYFITPEFIYVQSFQLLIIVTNFIFFVLTVIAYNRNVIRPADKDKWAHRKENFITMAKLFFFMIFLWIFEIVTSGIAADYGINETCTLRFIMDTPNAFFGLLVFYVMIISRPKVRKEVRASLSSIFLDPDILRGDKSGKSKANFKTQSTVA